MLASRRAYALSRLRVVHVGSWAWRLRAAVAPPHYVTLDVMTTYDTIKLYAYDSRGRGVACTSGPHVRAAARRVRN